MSCKYRVMDKCKAKDNIKDAFCFGKDSCPYYEDEVETIPKDEYEEQVKINNKLVNDNEQLRAYITMMQADYNARLKADMVTMLAELKSEMKEKSFYYKRIFCDNCDEKRVDLIELDDVNDIIQNKINVLKGENNE
ncbi:hypothetical protein bpr_II138 (plasmid) [Butyrivibrio proteoclasticus B316]|uniref:Uncharacterized protein n=1 Tax=Butyrivibrio proteoclasticus (strain ATCC 51982 / DSM 14932 / B316) TaxID=515622 RepID=E0S3U5_BUTPB|nr:hypothetical protein [Butyrivibrio proteoclasticus]ADL36077.1 hypothetical protein bpr_II138 [Butyrivibrio proteoclasticus B316]